MNRFMYGPDDRVEMVKEADLGALGVEPIPPLRVVPIAARADAGYNPNRDYNGRFAPGPHHERERLERVREESTTAARVQGHADHHARGEHEVHIERQAIANEHRAAAAGHIGPMSTTRLAEYDAVHAKIQHEAATRRAELDEHQSRAVAALHALQSRPEHEHHKVNDPTDSHENASNHLGAVAAHAHQTSYEPAEVSTHPAPYSEHAAAVQAQFEQLHAFQARAADETKQAMRDHGRAMSRMTREADNYEASGVRIPEAHEAHADARRAAETLSGAEMTRRDELASPMSNHLEDTHGALREAARETAQTVRDLAKITGRAPQLVSGKR